MFYQNTYITAIIHEEHMVYLWDSQAMTSLPHFHFDRDKQLHMILC